MIKLLKITVVSTLEVYECLNRKFYVLLHMTKFSCPLTKLIYLLNLIYLLTYLLTFLPLLTT